MLSEDAAHHILADVDTGCMGNLLSNSRAPESRITALHLENRRDEILRGPFWPWSLTVSGREQQSVFPLDQPSVKAQQRRWPYSNRNLREAVRSDQTGTDAEEQPPGRATRTNVVTRWAMRAKSSMIAVNMTAYPSVRKHALDAPEPIELEFARDTTKPEYPAETMAFMFETRAVICPTAVALALPQLQSDYSLCWRKLHTNFSPKRDSD
jgi:hypothetical protein